MTQPSYARLVPLWKFSICLLLTGSMVVLFPGCTSFRPAPQVVTPEEKAQLPSQVSYWASKLEQEGERNAVINLTEMANAALIKRDAIDEALLVKAVDRSLDEAIRRIEAIYADTPECQKARSLWHEESSKDFKGEPYERSFVFLLRGLRYYEAGDFENARACFMSGLLQDSLSVEGRFSADMPTFEYLSALCNVKLGEDQAAEEAIARARTFRPAMCSPDKNSNLLVVGLVGGGPVKNQIGDYQEILLITDGTTQTTGFDLCAPWFGCTPAFVSAVETDDLGFQARTRGGRAIDTINKRKASAKDVAEKTAKIAAVTGTALLSTAAIMAIMQSANKGGGDSKGAAAVMGVAIALLVIAVAVTLISKAMKTKADIRTITAVPGHIYLWGGRVLPGNQSILLRHNQRAVTQVKSVNVSIPSGCDHTVVYLRLP